MGGELIEGGLDASLIGEVADRGAQAVEEGGRARIQVDARILLPEGGSATTLVGRFVAISKR